MNDVMVDLETMGTGPNAAIIAIGAVEFDLDACRTGSQFYQVVTLESSVAGGGVIDPSTVMWWLGQSEDARKAVQADGEHINVALQRFSVWLGQRALLDELRLWGNGAGFDNVVLEAAYQRAQHPCPWRFYNNRCYRTMKGLHPDVKAVRQGTHHNALDDAITQARHLIAVMNHRPAAQGAGSLWIPTWQERRDEDIKLNGEAQADALAYAAYEIADLRSAFARPTASGAAAIPDIKAMVDRFLGWPLPTTFGPDGGINFDGRKDDEWNKNKTWPVGTNLFTADEAKAMFEHCLGGAK